MVFSADHFTLEQIQQGCLIAIDKPLEWTSFQVVNKVRWMLRKKFGLKKLKVGHCGTLDPLATGLLLICVGPFTKKIQEYQGLEKTYTGTFMLGATTPSYDMETAIDKHFPTEHIQVDTVQQMTATFQGDIQQVPPLYSALKKEGKRLYEFARAGETTELQSRAVRISSFEVYPKLPEVEFKVVCSKGTYIRSLAHDFGKALNSGAYLSSLRREKIGAYDLENAFELRP
ncbi:MAG: tRNA pseudouridine(55) synthase TruB [Flavobacteriaceae bacterium]